MCKPSRGLIIFFNKHRHYPVGPDPKVARSRYFRDRHMSLLVTAAGWLILFMLASLIWQLVSQSLPLLATPKAELTGELALPDAQILHIGDLRRGGLLLARDRKCQLLYYRLDAADNLTLFDRMPYQCEMQLKSFAYQGQTYLVSLSKSNMLRLEALFVSNARVQHERLLSFAVPGLHSANTWQMGMSKDHFAIAFQRGDRHWHSVWTEILDPTHFSIHSLGQAETLLLLPKVQQLILLNHAALSVKSADNELLQTAQLPSAVTSAQVLPSQHSILLSFEDGSTQQWSSRISQGKLALAPTYSVDTDAKINAVLIAQKANAHILLDTENKLSFYNSASGEVLRRQAVAAEIDSAYWYANNFYVLAGNRLLMWDIKGLAGFNSWKTLFAKNWYEGYQAPAYVWQSTAATDTQQTKYSLVPLIIGSFKAALLALMIAIPVAISAAVYTAYFATEKLRNWIKPAIEMLEAVPSVIIGFIAAVWLTPISERLLLPLVLLIVLLPLSLFLISFLQRRLLRWVPRPLRRNWELLFASLFLLSVFALVFNQSEALNAYLNNLFNWRDSKSTLVVALALGVAIAPSIYSVAEDAIFGVPQQIKNASFALGATRLQTLQNVVLVVSLPGILSAITLGFGRAFGETMILLMVTGNTPIAQWDLVSGIRALTANLAIELPEAQPASELYHVLFFSALVLFVFTFLLNGVAEWLRVRARKINQDA